MNDDTYTPIQKAAILLLSLEVESPGVTHEVLNKLGKTQSTQLLQSMSKLGHIKEDISSPIIEEFHTLLNGKRSHFGGELLPSHLFEQSFPDISHASLFEKSDQLFHFLNQVDNEKLTQFLLNEPPQLSALICSFLPEDKMAQLLSQFEKDISILITSKLLKIDIPNISLAWKIHHHLKDQLLKEKVSKESTDPYLKLSLSLEVMNPEHMSAIMTHFEQSDQEASQKIKSYMLEFGDLINLSDKDLQSLLYAIDPLSTLAAALSISNINVKNRILENLSERLKFMLEEEISNLPKELNENDAKIAQKNIIQTARELERNNKVNPLSELIEKRE